jgi:hypothetical protein
VTVWTISAQEGTGGDQVAAQLAAAAGVPLHDHNALAALAHDIDPDHLDAKEFDELEQRFGGRLTSLGLNMAMISGPVTGAAIQELQLRHKLPNLGRAVLAQAARCPCVILASSAFAALRDHPSSIHVRLRAPVACRVAAYQREHLVNHDCARKAIIHDDHIQRDWTRSIYHAELDDERLFTLVLDGSRFTRERLVNTLLAAGGIQTTPTAGAATHDSIEHGFRQLVQP